MVLSSLIWVVLRFDEMMQFLPENACALIPQVPFHWLKTTSAAAQCFQTIATTQRMTSIQVTGSHLPVRNATQKTRCLTSKTHTTGRPQGNVNQVRVKPLFLCDTGAVCRQKHARNMLVILHSKGSSHLRNTQGFQNAVPWQKFQWNKFSMRSFFAEWQILRRFSWAPIFRTTIQTTCTASAICRPTMTPT